MELRKAAHAKGVAALNIDGVTYRMNRHGVVFAPSSPDVFDGWETVNFAPSDKRSLMRELARPAVLRTKNGATVYSLRAARRAFDNAAAASAAGATRTTTRVDWTTLRPGDHVRLGFQDEATTGVFARLEPSDHLGHDARAVPTVIYYDLAGHPRRYLPVSAGDEQARRVTYRASAAAPAAAA